MHKFFNSATFGIGSGGALHEYDIPNGENVGILLARIDQLPMPALLLPNKDLGNTLAG
jgi:hypothetical protein